LITVVTLGAFIDQATERCDYGRDGENYQKDG